MVSYELAKELKEAGYLFQRDKEDDFVWANFKGDVGKQSLSLNFEQEAYWLPTLSELIEACGEEFYKLLHIPYTEEEQELCDRIVGIDVETLGWLAVGVRNGKIIGGNYGKTPKIAIARLWLALKK